MWSVHLNIDRHKCGQTSRPFVGAEIQTRRNLNTNSCSNNFFFLLVGVLVGLMHFFWRNDIPLIIAAALLLLCLVISVFSYTKIFLRLRQHQSELQDNVQQAQINGGGIPLNIARYKKTISGIAWVQLAFVACYVPFVVMAIIIYKGGWRKISDMVWLSAGTLVFLNSSLNTFLYCWKIRDVRQAVKDTIRQFCGSF